MATNTSSIDRLKHRIRSYLGYLQLYMHPSHKKEIIDEFHKLYYMSATMGGTWNDNHFLGYKILKCPFDQMVYQEIIYELKPDLIIETGTAFGGNALFMATLCDVIGKGNVVTIDTVVSGTLPKHKRIKYINGSSTDEKIVEKIKKLRKGKRKVMVILDSDHARDHVLEELKIYSKFVSKGSYLIVEDTNVNNNPVYPDHGPGPKEALDEWLQTNDKFEVDKSKEKHLFSFNTGGYLKKVE